MGELLSYRDEVVKAMQKLGEDPRVIFLGQTVAFPGSLVYDTLSKVPMEKRLELPVMEDTQMGLSIGLSLAGYIPVSIYPRFDFLLLATNQLVNHLDKIKEISSGQFKPKVIIRTMVGSTKPLDPGIQHCGDYTEAFRNMLREVDVVRLYKPESILTQYMGALHSERSTLLVEMASYFE